MKTYIVIKLTKIKDKGKILKAKKGKGKNNIQCNSHRVISRFLSRNTGQEGVT